MRALAGSILQNPQLAALPIRLESGGLPALITGLSPIHRAHLAAALRVETGRPLCVVCPDETVCESMARDIGAFLGEKTTVICARDYVFLSAEVASRSDQHRRIAALNAMNRGAGVVLATPAALMQRTIPPELMEKSALSVKDGETVPPETVERALLRCGYVRCELVEGVGQYSRRGSILDFFSPAYDKPVRIDFWGDDVDSMGLFDVQSQRRDTKLSDCLILPVAETVTALCEGGDEALALSLESAAVALRRSGRNETAKLRENLQSDAAALREGRALTAADRYMDLIYGRWASALDYLPPDALVIMAEPGRCAERAGEWSKQYTEDLRLLISGGTLRGGMGAMARSWDELCAALEDYPVIMADAFTVGRYPMEPRSVSGLTCRHLPSYAGNTETATEDVRRYMERGFRVVILSFDERRAGIMRELLEKAGIRARLEPELKTMPAGGECVVTVGGLSSGVEYPDAHLAILTDTQIARAGMKRSKRKKALSDRERIISYADLSVGDLVVHEYHGIGRFAGIVPMQVDGVRKDYVKICYAGSDTLYVPATNLDLVSKYIGGGAESEQVRLSKMGGADWKRAKSRAKAAVKQMAAELTALYAERSRTPGHAFPPDTPWQIEFEDAFEYPLTDDQQRCIDEIKGDMERESPMDRLLCGDVGYGKTEVAMRAIMKCVMDGMQAAILVPTTVLAQQHYQTAMQRFYGFPVNIQVLSRFRTPAQVKATVSELASGRCDIVIGTHRLLSKDIRFKKLGLLVVDEEQRFGVSHKEHIKELSKNVDVLTLSATPIPRTMNMALTGIRDMSTIEEPPADRLPVRTYVLEHDWGILCEAIRAELRRGGQVYYLHNRVENIEQTASRLAAMLEGVTVGVAHGKMDEEQLAAAMEGVSSGETEVLVCTTIIETGIDIPNVNTLIIEDADKLGLAQLHQIRGRVGRSNRRSSAYLTFRRDKVLSEVAEKRLTAIREFAEFNSGFRIAMRDLEMRGAGNLLGAEQSGHLTDVGYDMYLKLLEEAVLEERGEKPPVRAECSADLAVSANIPETYIRSAEQRMDVYRRIALIRSEDDANDIMEELIDRFGDPPPGVSALVTVAMLRGDASAVGVRDISQKGSFLRFELSDFDIAKVSKLYAESRFKGRVKVEASDKPILSLRLKTRVGILDEARAFIRAYGEA